VTYLLTGQGWMYLAIVLDLHSHHIIGWSIHNFMTVDLVERAMQMALNLKILTKGLIFNSDCSGQVKLATDLYSSQYLFSDSFGVNPPL
jgi:putative transposase